MYIDSVYVLAFRVNVILSETYRNKVIGTAEMQSVLLGQERGI